MATTLEVKTLKTFTKAELERADGRDGGPALVAVDGKVYDVSSSKLWKDGAHLNSHHAGEDLSLAFKAAPHGVEVLEDLELVGTVSHESFEPAVASRPWAVEKLLGLHPHPISVHFPIALTVVAAAFMGLSLLARHRHLEISALYCVFAAGLTAPVAIVSGLLSWYYNYSAIRTRIFHIKMTLSVALLVLQIGALVMRLVLVDEPSLRSPGYCVYAVLVMAMAPMVAYLGYLGGKLTFPH
ncbi:MAG: DUF2231 domain-containing protein [Planctomycetota bacterium]|jgi:predicted heme/steroid binding protein/uncharacterized membrane protein